MKRLFVILGALAVLVAACGGTTTETSADAAAATDASESTATSAAVQEDDKEDTGSDELDLGDDGELSLDDFIPGARAFDENTDYRSQEMEIQQAIAECMAAEGFDYIPWVPTDVGGGFAFDEFDEEEYVKTYGFGVSTWVLQDDMFGYDPEDDPWANNPNNEIVDAMDDFERDEYYRILYGGEPPLIENTPPEELDAMSEEELMAFYDEAYSDWRPDGCESGAYDDAYGGEEDMAFWEEFGQDFEDIYSRAESDPRIVEAQASWSSCMAEKGHDFATQQDMYDYFWGTESGGTWVEGEFQQRVNEVVTWPEPEFGDFGEGEVIEEDGSVSVATTAVAVAEGEDGEFEYFGPEYDIEELQPLIDEELAIATADYQCSIDIRDIWEQVYKDLEKQFIDQNLDRLLAFREQNG